MIKPIIIGLLLLSVVFNVNAEDSERIQQLEQEIQEIKLRLSKLETLPDNLDAPQEVEISSDGWKSIANWRKLTTKMEATDAENILGEPNRIDGGSFTHWHYQNGGKVTLYEGTVYQWTEPR